LFSRSWRVGEEIFLKYPELCGVRSNFRGLGVPNPDRSRVEWRGVYIVLVGEGGRKGACLLFRGVEGR